MDKKGRHLTSLQAGLDGILLTHTHLVKKRRSQLHQPLQKKRQSKNQYENNYLKQLL
jgi:hypothetical protein